MKVKTKTIVEPFDDVGPICPHKKGDVRTIIPIEYSFCCCYIEEAIKKRYLIFGEDDCFLNKDANINIIRTSSYPSGTVVDHYPISFCPFCGSKVLIENVVTIEASS